MFLINSITLIIYVLNSNLIIKNFIKILINKDCPYLLFHSLTEIILIYILIYLIIIILFNYIYFNYKIFQKQSLFINLLIPCLILMTLKEIYFIILSLTTEKLMFEFHLYSNLKMIIIISIYIFIIRLYLNYIQIKNFFKKNILFNQLIILFLILLNILPPQISLFFLVFILVIYNIEINKMLYLKKIIRSNFARSRI